MRRRWMFAATALLVTLASCTLLTSVDDLQVVPDTADTSDTSPDGATNNNNDSGVTSSTDATVIVDGGSPIVDSFLEDVQETVVDGCSTTGCFTMPTGFSLVAFNATASAGTCPTGFAAQADDTVEGPSVAPAACTCGCAVTANPTCPVGNLVGKFDSAGSGLCDNGGQNIDMTCGTGGFLGPFGAGNEHRFTPPGATGGACNGSTNKDDTKLSYAAHNRVCQATTLPSCNNQVCPPALGGPFKACIGAPGDVACPANFQKHLVGTSATYSCQSTCSCTGVSASCGGKLNYFDSADCSGAAEFSYAVNDTCVPTNAMGSTYSSHIYVNGGPQNIACGKGGASSPSTPQLNQPTTVCCN
jgi:hypothetical protein